MYDQLNEDIYSMRKPALVVSHLFEPRSRPDNRGSNDFESDKTCKTSTLTLWVYICHGTMTCKVPDPSSVSRVHIRQRLFMAP